MIENIGKKNEELEYQFMQLEQKTSFEKASFEKSKALIENQKQSLAIDLDNLNRDILLYKEEISKLNDLRSKEMKEKNSEIAELKKNISDKIEELTSIENKIQAITLDSSKISSPNEQSGPRSL